MPAAFLKMPRAGVTRSVAMPSKTTPSKPKPGASKNAGPMKAAKIEKPVKGNKPNALQQALKPSESEAAVVGEGQLNRGEAVSKVWAYIKANKLQNPKDGREILADDKLRKVFGKDKVTMFEMNKHLALHLK
jgi:chromatin remodeling complex protein RSC6